MIRHINIRSKVILSVVLLVTLLFGIVEYQNMTKIDHLITSSEESRNELLIETAIPVLAINLAFGLNDANSDYLEKIAAKNANIRSLVLEDAAGNVLYRYSQPESEINQNTEAIERSIFDNATGKVIGLLRIEFTNIYKAALKAEHRSFTVKFIAVFLLFMVLFVTLLNIAFLPLKELLGKIRQFSPERMDHRFTPTKNSDEVGIIHNAFAQMAERIREYNSERERFTRDLEAKVQERTLLLSEQKEALEEANGMLENKIVTIREQEEMLIAQSRLAAMGEMMSMIAHQWRQPLSTMSLMITDYELRAMMEGREPDERDEVLKKISDTLTYMSGTVNDFQTYFKPSNKVEEIPVADIIERALHFTNVRMELYGITVETKCASSITMETYANELVQVLVNLLNNAVDVIRDRETEKRWIHIVASQDDQEVRIRVSDSGGGVPEAIMEKVFEPYFSTKSKNGTGLGLYMAKMIVEKHGHGTIMLENGEEGAEFILRFAKEYQS